MSWKDNKPSAHEYPMHYLGARLFCNCISPDRTGKLFKRIDPELTASISQVVNSDDGSSAATLMANLSMVKVHIWSSNTFTVCFLESGQMGATLRNMKDDPDLDRAIEEATARAFVAFLTEQKADWESMAAGNGWEDLSETIVPVAAGEIPRLVEKIKVHNSVMEGLSKEFEAQRRAKESLIRRDERNIRHYDPGFRGF